MSKHYRELAERSADHHDAYIRMADIVDASTCMIDVDATELVFMTEELNLATAQVGAQEITIEAFDEVLGEHVKCLEAWVNRAYIK